jgi:uncharacterized protein
VKNMADQGQGNFGNTDQHREAGKQSDSNQQNPSQNLSQQDRSKGGQASGGNFKNDPQRASDAGEESGGGNP